VDEYDGGASRHEMVLRIGWRGGRVSASATGPACVI